METSHTYVTYYVQCDYNDYRAHKGGAWLTNARDEVYGTLNVATAGLTGGASVVGEVHPRFAATLTGNIGSH